MLHVAVALGISVVPGVLLAATAGGPLPGAVGGVLIHPAVGGVPLPEKLELA